MKRLLILAISVLVLLSSCFIFNWKSTEWEGDLSDMTEGLYILTVEQSGRDVVFKGQVADAKRAALIAALPDGAECSPPDEIFGWMSPTFADDPIQTYNYTPKSEIMFPVGRKTVTADFYADREVSYDTDTEKRIDTNTNPVVQVRVSLEDIANDWNRDWLSTDHFNDAEDAQYKNDMNGVRGLVADNYRDANSGNGYIKVSLTLADYDLTDTEEPGDQEFGFQNSAPFGYGYSKVAWIPADDWIPVIIAEKGITISTESVYGGVPFVITLQLEAGTALGSGVSIPLDSQYGTFYLNNGNYYTTDTETGIHTWKIVYTTDTSYAYTEYDESGKWVYYVPAPYIGDHYSYLTYGDVWSQVHFYYYGYATTLNYADFENGFTWYDGSDSAVGELTKEVADTYHPWYGTYMDNTYNNWATGPLEDDMGITAGLSAAGGVLGTGSGGTLSASYDPYRWDALIVPDVNLWDIFYNSSGSSYDSTGFYGTVSLTFDLYYDLDFNYNDYFSVEIERWAQQYNYETGKYEWYSYWQTLETFYGPLCVSENNGWATKSYQLNSYIDTCYTYDAYYTFYGPEQRIRLKFFTDSAGSGRGVFIDNLKIMTVE